jgi:hypothetical protein
MVNVVSKNKKPWRVTVKEFSRKFLILGIRKTWMWCKSTYQSDSIHLCECRRLAPSRASHKVSISRSSLGNKFSQNFLTFLVCRWIFCGGKFIMQISGRRRRKIANTRRNNRMRRIRVCLHCETCSKLFK